MIGSVQTLLQYLKKVRSMQRKIIDKSVVKVGQYFVVFQMFEQVKDIGL
jgi:hypothetical protein